ncbi:Hypothetical predicted protein [Podarcis lilfordi]|uniref:Uncharacterized protein n=1 Tax=Podarcis lilfordi TaxID=74358 RepID=A0AA35K8E5_9SAUR|nr:Hypothetical predicted protein [Podarcis lilfordi]
MLREEGDGLPPEIISRSWETRSQARVLFPRRRRSPIPLSLSRSLPLRALAGSVRLPTQRLRSPPSLHRAPSRRRHHRGHFPLLASPLSSGRGGKSAGLRGPRQLTSPAPCAATAAPSRLSPGKLLLPSVCLGSPLALLSVGGRAPSAPLPPPPPPPPPPNATPDKRARTPAMSSSAESSGQRRLNGEGKKQLVKATPPQTPAQHADTQSSPGTPSSPEQELGARAGSSASALSRWFGALLQCL